MGRNEVQERERAAADAIWEHLQATLRRMFETRQPGNRHHDRRYVQVMDDIEDQRRARRKRRKGGRR